MNKKFLVLLPVLALLGQGCEAPGPQGPVATVPTKETKEMCAVQTPQVYFHARATFTAAQLAQIRRDVVAPITSFYSGDAQGRVVSISIRKDERDIIVDIIVDHVTSDDPVYEGVLISPSADGTYQYVPTEAGPGYEG